MLHSRRDGDGQRGQIIVLFELCLIVILGCAALVIDLGLLRNNRQILVNTMDSAALAAGSQLPVTGLLGPLGDGANGATKANALISANIQANFPGLTGYTIAYKCLIGADPVTGAPLISRDIPAACNPPKGVGHTPVVAGDFKGAGPTRLSDCRPDLGDKCNVVVITGSETTPYSIGPVVGVKSGSTGTVVSAACNGPCGASPVVPVDLVIILDRTRSMTDGWPATGGNANGVKIHDLQDAAKAVLGVYDPAKQRVALALTGPSMVDASGNPTLGSCPDGGTAVGTSTDNNFFPTTTLSGATTTLKSATTTLKDPTTTLTGPITTLSAAINRSTTTIPVTSKAGFPTTFPFNILVDSEQMSVKASPSGTTWTVSSRGSGVAHTINAPVSVPGAINNSTTTIPVTSKAGFPTSFPFTIQIDSEQMTVTGDSGTTAWTVSARGSGVAHSSGATAILVVTNTSTTIYVALATAFPSTASTTTPFSIKVDSEQMSVTGVSGTAWNVTRGTGAVTHNTNAPVSWDVGKADPTIFVASAAGFPSVPFTIQIDSELMTVTGVSGTTWAVPSRGSGGAVHAGGAAVNMVVGKTDMTIRVASAIGFPASGNFTILVDNEQMQVGSVSGTDTPTTTLSVTRATSPATHAAGATVTNLTSWVPDAATAGVWVPVGLSGTDTTDPLPDPKDEAGTYEIAGTVNTATPIVKAINCITALTGGTTLSMPLAYAKWYLDTYGRSGVAKGILLETDGHPENSTNAYNAPQFTCTAAIAAATAAKAEGIKVYAVGYGISGTCGDKSFNSQELNVGMTATDLLQNHIASGSAAPYFFSSPTGSDLAGYFRQIAADLAHSGAHLIQLYPAPIVTGVSSGTSPVTISGQYFTGADLVTFGGMPATVSPGMTDTTMTVPTLPSGCHGPVDVVVRTPNGGTSAITSADRYTCP
jgi:hypothetical protein